MRKDFPFPFLQKDFPFYKGFFEDFILIGAVYSPLDARGKLLVL